MNSQDSKKLVINADDFGLDEDVDRGIIELAKVGSLSAVSVLISAEKFSESRLDELLQTDVSVGVHLALTETRPMSSSFPSSWLDEVGNFPLNWRSLFSKLIYSRLKPESIHQEWSEQFSCLQSLLSRRGRKVAYLDSHQNVHFWPSVAPVAESIRAENSLPLIRVFRDPIRVSKPLCSVAILLGRYLFKDRHSLPSYGIHESGRMDFEGFNRIVRRNQELNQSGVIVVHPGRAPLNSSMSYALSWEQELSLLSGEPLAALLCESGIEVVTVEKLFEECYR